MSEDEHISDLHAGLLVLFSQHLPQVWDYDDPDDCQAFVGCSCGNPLYVGHIIRPILATVAKHTPAPEARA